MIIKEAKALKYPIILDIQHYKIERENTKIKDYLEEWFKELYYTSDSELFGYIDWNQVIKDYENHYLQINSYEEFNEKYNIEDFGVEE